MDDLNNRHDALLDQLRSLRDWSERQLLKDSDWQGVTEYMSAVLDALIAGQIPPAQPY
ncbi:hypothetical protein Asp14428_48750 [Actinoplanes sp. NBRC 14428]|nr:hypothetical protein Asp14428_48750 [Actinoplanes sp. NBRC 14428]